MKHFYRTYLLCTLDSTDDCSLLTSENVVEVQQSHMEEMERASELLQDEIRKKEEEYELRLLQVRQQQTSKMR